MALWITLILLAFLAAFVGLLELLCHNIRDSLERQHERTEEDQRRRTFIQNCLAGRKRY